MSKKVCKNASLCLASGDGEAQRGSLPTAGRQSAFCRHKIASLPRNDGDGELLDIPIILFTKLPRSAHCRNRLLSSQKPLPAVG
ncbi:hypothetical protein SAMN05660206_106211 [Sphingobacterium wenxiniae]|uniref:Uncharacterized protein n=1 Tax=Sphingobacterium wenxiniae TaxID=683125 RepID=A0A1I6TL34_9SPHI|nr:hypothetical protein SAMN05660206_106211 [Sphingobacterium wenxiniae]